MSKQQTKRIETPGSTSDELNKSQDQITQIEDKIKTIDEAIAKYRAVIDNETATDEDKQRAQTCINDLIETKSLIEISLGEATAALNTIKSQAQVQAANARKIDLTDINVNERKNTGVNHPGMTLTKRGYIVGSKNGSEK